MEENPIIVSICIPTYNGEAYLSTLIESLVAQAINSMEIVICDDLSTDATFEIAKKYASNYEHIYAYQNSENLGMDGNFLQSVRHAKGKYIWVCGQDEKFNPGAIDKFNEIITAYPDIDYIYFNYRFFSGDLTKEVLPPKLNIPDDKYYCNHLEYFLEIEAAPSFLPSAIMRKSFWDSTPTEQFLKTHYVQVGVWLHNFKNKATYVVSCPDYISCRMPDTCWKYSDGQMLFEIFSGNMEVYTRIYLSEQNPIPDILYKEMKSKFFANFFNYIFDFTKKGFQRNKILNKRMRYLLQNESIAKRIYVRLIYYMPVPLITLINKIREHQVISSIFRTTKRYISKFS